MDKKILIYKYYQEEEEKENNKEIKGKNTKEEEYEKYIKPFNSIGKRPKEKRSHNNIIKKLEKGDFDYIPNQQNNYINYEEDIDKNKIKNKDTIEYKIGEKIKRKKVKLFLIRKSKLLRLIIRQIILLIYLVEEI